MAIYSAVPPPPDSPPPAATGHNDLAGSATPHAAAQHHPHHGHQANPSVASAVDIEAWTVSALQALSVSPIARGTGGTPLTIPIDDDHHHESGHKRKPNGTARVTIDPDHPAAGMVPPRRPLSRRDSQRTRDMLLKGKEGSRQRRRWENDRLMHVPNAQPPLPTDWHVHPTHPVRNHLPYQLASLWDQRGDLRHRAEATRAAAAERRKRAAGILPARSGVEAGKVPRDLRATAKKTPAVRSWVRVLEEPVRRRLLEAERARVAAAAAVRDAASESSDTGDDDDDMEEEVVFAGRQARSATVDAAAGVKRAHREVRDRPVDQGMVFDALGDDETAAFKRWLTHSISDYYGLASRSATVGSPSRRVVYVTIQDARSSSATRVHDKLPPPMWELV